MKPMNWVWEEYLRRKQELADKKQGEKTLMEWSEELDKVIEEKYGPDPPTTAPDKIIEEIPPLPELNTIKFPIKQGDPEKAMWIRHGTISGHLTEVMIGIAIIEMYCPMARNEVACPARASTFKELFLHFKNAHYGEKAMIADARQLYYDLTVSAIQKDTPPQVIQDIVQRASNPTFQQLQTHINHVKNRTESWRNIAYAMLQECFVYEANSRRLKGRGSRPQYDKRASVCYKMQKVYGLTTSQISKMFDRTQSAMRQVITDGLMLEHGNKDDNLPAWMQRALKKQESS